MYAFYNYNKLDIHTNTPKYLKKHVNRLQQSIGLLLNQFLFSDNCNSESGVLPASEYNGFSTTACDQWNSLSSPRDEFTWIER